MLSAASTEREAMVVFKMGHHRQTQTLTVHVRYRDLEDSHKILSMEDRRRRMENGASVVEAGVTGQGELVVAREAGRLKVSNTVW